MRAQVALEGRERDKSSAGRLRIQDVLAVQLRGADGALAVLGRFYGLRIVVRPDLLLGRRVVLGLAEVAKIKLAHGLRQRALRRRDQGCGARRQRYEQLHGCLELYVRAVFRL